MTNSNQAKSRITALILVVALLFSVAAIPVFAEASDGEPTGAAQETEAPGDLEPGGGENTETEEITEPAEGGDKDNAPPTQDPDQPEDEETDPANEADERGTANRAPTDGPVTLGYSSIVAFASLDADVAEQEVTTGTPLEELTLPDTLAATMQDEDGQQAQADVPVAQWSAAPEYAPDTIGTYTFTPELGLGYTLADGVKPPEITVRVFMGVMPLSAATVNVGDYVYFGQYGGEDILWLVTSTSSGVTLRSVYVLFDSVYHRNDDPVTTTSLTFETADIYDAVKAIFTTAEQAQITGYGLSPSRGGNGYTTAGVQTTYWTNSDPEINNGVWSVIYAGSGAANVSVTNPHGVRPVITIGSGLSEYDSPRIAALTPSDTVFVKGEGRTDPLTVAIQGEAHAGDTLRVRLENSVIAEYTHTLTADDLTDGAFDLEWTVTATDLEAHADGIYLLSAELVRTAGIVETTLHTWDGIEYRIYTEGGDLIGANNTPANTTKVSFGTDNSNGGSPAEWYVIETGSGYWTLLAAGRMGTSQFNPPHLAAITHTAVASCITLLTLYSPVLPPKNWTQSTR